MSCRTDADSQNLGRLPPGDLSRPRLQDHILHSHYSLHFRRRIRSMPTSWLEALQTAGQERPTRVLTTSIGERFAIGVGTRYTRPRFTTRVSIAYVTSEGHQRPSCRGSDVPSPRRNRTHH